jgi:hypothetical protein
VYFAIRDAEGELMMDGFVDPKDKKLTAFLLDICNAKAS